VCYDIILNYVCILGSISSQLSEQIQLVVTHCHQMTTCSVWKVINLTQIFSKCDNKQRLFK